MGMKQSFFKTVLAGGVAAIAVNLGGPAFAQQRNFDVPKQDASKAIAEFARQAGLQIIAPSDQLRGVTTPAIKGSYDARAALRSLLAGTDLEIVSDNGGVIILRKTTLPQSAEVAEEPLEVETITVIGSQIKGAQTTGALPVSVIGREAIQATGAVSGNDLFRTLPQAGDVTFNEQWLGGNSPNAARGDVSTVSLRGLGQGNTLVLLNGRRMVAHPTSQADNSIPVFGYNINAVPVAGLERVEILRDGAAALYGSDAVAGVVNNVLRSDFQGLTLASQYGGAEGTSLREFQFDLFAGRAFAEGRGNVTLFAGFTERSKLRVGEQDYTARMDRRALVDGTSFAGVTNFDTRGAHSPWAGLQTPASFGAITRNGVALTNTSGQFHIQPTTSAGCLAALSGGVCIDDGVVTGTADRDLRYDANGADGDITQTPSVQRYNLFGTLTYDLTDDVKFFSELGYYTANTNALIGANSVLSVPITVSAANYYNPFGAITSPNRLSGLTLPAAGVPVTLVNYALDDVGSRAVEVENQQYRVLAGFNGKQFGWDWESAALYSAAKVTDTSDGISNTLFQRALARSTPDAYNPFSGGDPANPSLGDTSPSSDVSSFVVKNTRKNKTTLALWDFKVSRPDLLNLPAGGLGVALGVELRRETYKDDRDARQDGTITFTDSITGRFFGSDLMQASPSLDVRGHRSVSSAYAELSAPLVSPEMNIPLIRAAELQLAGRYEDYSDVGSVAKPKVALSWDVIQGVRLRTSWSQGFKAPNLETLNTEKLQRSYAGNDYLLCEADLRARRITSFATCARNVTVVSVISGNKNLKPEKSESFSYGAVLKSFFLPVEYGEFTFTVDRWKIDQSGIVGILSDQNALILDYMQRLSGSSNAAVTRAPVTASDEAIFAGTGITPVGQIASVNSQFQNLLPRSVGGVDLELSYRSPSTAWGRFNISVNAAHLLRFYQAPSDIEQSLLDAQKAGQISANLPISGTANLVADNGRPEWKVSANLSWSLGGWSAGAFTQYVDAVNNTGVLDPQSNVWEVDSTLTTNLYSQYRWSQGEAETELRLGVRNIGDKDPPLAATGYLGGLYQPMARYWYASLRKTF